MNIIDQNTQLNFASWSGDFNPVHVDPLYARRSMYGEQVAHGVNVLLLALNYFAKENKINFQLGKIDVKFLKPIFLNTVFKFEIISNQNNTVTINVRTEDVVCTHINFDFYQGSSSSYDQIKFTDRPPVEKPSVFSVQKQKDVAHEMSILYDFNDFSALYPDLLERLGKYQIGVILSLTRLVGMYCPGFNSLFSSFSLKFKKALKSNRSFNYRLQNYDERFSLYDINVFSDHVDGSIIAFNRPSSVAQSSCEQLEHLVQQGEFADQRALIVGGSRGLGELTAKLLSIGGAHVLVSYNKGEKDCNRVTDDINTNGGKSRSIKLNILDNNFEYFDSLSQEELPTHIYYYATPFIFSGHKNTYSKKLFDSFAQFYVEGFYNLVEYFASRDTKNFFYPSTVALDEFSPDMLEYTLAKAAGDKLCDFLKTRYVDVNFYTTKLPRLATDQTVSLFPVINDNPEQLILKHLRVLAK